jgi:hypothetical protein
MTLPEVGRKELSEVLARRAAQLADCPANDALYAGLPGAKRVQTGGRESHEECSWTLLALRRSFARELSGQLAKQGVRTTRIVAARLAVLSHVDRELGAVEGATLVIDFEPGVSIVSLIDGARLVHQTVLDGDLVERPGLALAIVQEARSFESTWRRESRGAPLGRACVVGLDPERGQLFRNALSNALPNVETVCWPVVSEREGAGRMATLAACLARGRFDLDLTVPTPWSLSRRIGVAAAAFAVVGSMGVVAERHVEWQREELQSEVQAILESTADLETLESEVQSIGARRSELESEVARLVDLYGRGLQLETVLGDAFGAFQGDSSLVSIDARPSEGRVHFVGATHPHPLRAMSAVQAAREALERSPSFRDVVVEAPGGLPSDADVAAGVPFTFSLSAALEGPR